MSKLAIFFPGIGYTCDKPLLYYSRKIAKEKGYDEICIEYNNLPSGVKGDNEKKKQALYIAYEQALKQLKDVELTKYDDVLIVAKSLGTVVATKYHEECCSKARLVLYTPVEATFRFKINDAISFIGDSDSWSDLATVKDLADKAGVPLYIYPECNHSLEVSDDYAGNLEIIKDVMKKTFDYIK